MLIVIAAVIPVSAAYDASPSFLALLGALIVVLEGLQQLFQWQNNWTLYRSTAEALKHEKYAFLSRAGTHATEGADVDAILADRVEALVSQEHGTLIETRHQADPQAAAAEQQRV